MSQGIKKLNFNEKRPFLLITGMHRSGTSFLARALNLQGVYLGGVENLNTNDWYYDQSNPRGHWENKKFLEISEKILKLNEGDWDRIPKKIKIDEKLGKEITEWTTSLEKQNALAVGFKDPRVILFLEHYVSYFPKDFILIGIFRDPLKVAESLKIRNNFSYEKSLNLWKNYNEKLLNHLKHHNGFLLNFDWPKERLFEELNLIAKKLDLVNNVDLSEWYSKDLFRSDKTYQQKFALPNEIKEVYINLKQRSEKNNEIEISIKRNPNDVRKIVDKLVIEIQELGKYCKKINDKNLHILENLDQTEPIAVLTSIYSKRVDLRETFPEVSKGDYSKLVEWAIAINANKVKGEEKTIETLEKFLPWYKEHLKSLMSIKTTVNYLQSINELENTLLVENERIEDLEAVRENNLKRIEDLKDKNVKNKYKIQNIENKIHQNEEEIDKLRSELAHIKNSFVYNLARKIGSFLDDVAPQNSKGGFLLRKILSKLYKNKILAHQENSLLDFQYEYTFDDYVDEKSYSMLCDSFKNKPKISIITPTYKSNLKFLKNAINSVKNQYYANWELCICDDGSKDPKLEKFLKLESTKTKKIKIIISDNNEGIALASNKAINLADGEYLLLLDHDDELSKNALLEVVKLINDNPNIDFIYSDEDKIDEYENHVEPFFKPDWSPDLFFSYNFPIHISVFKTQLLKEMGGFRKEFDGGQDYDLILRYLEKVNNIHHIPKVLYSWRKSSGSTALEPGEKKYAFNAGKRALEEALQRRKIEASVEEGIQKFTYRIKYKIKETPLISIIIPTRTIENIKTCVESILSETTYKYFEILVLDSSMDDRIQKYCKKFDKIKCIRNTSEKFSFSKVNNQAVKQSNGKYVIFLNDDTKVITPSWIENMLEHAQRNEIGAVGCKLLYRDDRVQHAGTVIGIQRHAGNYGGMGKNQSGYFSFPNIIRNCSAVTAACMMMKKDIFNQIGGYDELLERSWQDVDLCIRVIKSGKLVVYTPYSVLYHFEGLTRGSKDTTRDELNARKVFFQKNKDFIEKGDPFYNPNLSLMNPYKFRKQLSEPLQILSDIYEERKDLQLTFPDDHNKKFQQMVDWAVTHGIITDSHKEFLEKYYDYYFNNCSEQAKPLAKKMRMYLESPKLQNDFPEVIKGNYSKFLKFVDKNLN